MTDAAARAQQPDPKNYRTIPALKEYIERIGAEQINFRRFVVSGSDAVATRQTGSRSGSSRTAPSTVWAKEKGTAKDFEPTEESRQRSRLPSSGWIFPLQSRRRMPRSRNCALGWARS